MATKTFFVLFMAATLMMQACMGCSKLPNWKALQTALKAAVKPSGGPMNGGFELHMWATLVALDGKVCAVAYSGEKWSDQWLHSRQISAQKAYTANGLSLPGFALSTANLYSAVQPGGSLYGLQHANPTDGTIAYDGAPTKWGTAKDPLVGMRMGGTNVFGGGLALYNMQGERVGGLGVSGDTSCADHNVAWRIRAAFKLDYNVMANNTDAIGGVRQGTDAMIVDRNGALGTVPDTTGVASASPSSWGHPLCSQASYAIGNAIGAVYWTA